MNKIKTPVVKKTRVVKRKRMPEKMIPVDLEDSFGNILETVGWEESLYKFVQDKAKRLGITFKECVNQTLEKQLGIIHTNDVLSDPSLIQFNDEYGPILRTPSKGEVLNSLLKEFKGWSPDDIDITSLWSRQCVMAAIEMIAGKEVAR